MSMIGGFGRASRAFINHGADETPRDRYPSLSSLLCLLPGFFLLAPRQALVRSCRLHRDFSETVGDANLGYLNAYSILASASN